MAVSANDIRWVAHLARLEFNEDEIEHFTQQFNQILSYVDQLKEVNTQGVEPLAHALPIHNVFRDDEPAPSLPREEALVNAPARRGEFYGVPAVLD
jgi:aspartyl-tRNA(Asn)/glutamyl-tRNA(Gln) amidotransferase subunit C